MGKYTFGFLGHVVKKQRPNSSSSSSNWWKNYSLKFPVLARIVKDILAIPASTIASKSAFTASRRDLDEKRSHLTP
ncbi:Zinc finger BED domain-containing protein RICESLEEPER 2 [Bienertia sinuspersici]